MLWIHTSCLSLCGDRWMHVSHPKPFREVEMEAAIGVPVISVGSDPELVWLRDYVLQTAGFNVLSTTDASDALARVKRGECAILVLCYSLSSGVMQDLSGALKEYCPRSRTLFITNVRADKPEFADALVYGVEGPEALIESINALVAQRAESAEA